MREVSYSRAVQEGLRQGLESDPRSILIHSASELRDSAEGLREEFGPDRVMTADDFSADLIGGCLGLALTGLRPVACFRAGDASRHLAAIMNHLSRGFYSSGGRQPVPVVLRLIMDDPGRRSGLDTLFMRLPGLLAAAPSTPYDAKGLLIEAMGHDNPVMFMEQESLADQTGPVPAKRYTIPFGQAEVVRRGGDVTIAATQAMVGPSLEAAAEAVRLGIDVEIIDLRTPRPLDRDTLFHSIRKTGRLVVVDQGPGSCGPAAEIPAMVAAEAIFYLKGPLLRVCAPDLRAIQAGRPLACLPGPDEILAAVRSLMDYA